MKYKAQLALATVAIVSAIGATRASAQPLQIQETLYSFTPVLWGVNTDPNADSQQLVPFTSNTWVFESFLTQNGAVVGSAVGHCVRINAYADCDETMALLGGKLMVTGTTGRLGGDYVLVGGTGHWANVRGRAVIHTTNTISGYVRDVSQWTFNLEAT